MSQQDEQDAKRRKRSLRVAEKAIRALLTSPDGLRRLRDISDDEWQAAVDADEANSGEA